jgi:hypothetical protein
MGAVPTALTVNSTRLPFATARANGCEMITGARAGIAGRAVPGRGGPAIQFSGSLP